MADEKKPPQQDVDLKALMEVMLRREAKIANKENEQEEKEKADADRRYRELMENAKREEDARHAKRVGCPHAIQNAATGKQTSAWRAQVNADGCFRPTCCLCQTEMPRIKATENMIREGVNLHTYHGVTIAGFEAWHKRDFPNSCGVDNCHVCHPMPVTV